MNLMHSFVAAGVIAAVRYGGFSSCMTRENPLWQNNPVQKLLIVWPLFPRSVQALEPGPVVVEHRLASPQHVGS